MVDLLADPMFPIIYYIDFIMKKVMTMLLDQLIDHVAIFLVDMITN